MKETKLEIRERICKIRDDMRKEVCREKSRQICNNIINTSYYQNADTVYLYMAFRNEVDLFDVIQTAFADGKTIAIPKIHEDQQMRFHQLRRNQAGCLMTENGYFGIEEPVILPEEEEKPLSFPDLILMPGVAFDKAGNRIGYGKGYYDTYLESLGECAKTVKKVGVAYACQIVEDIPVSKHDYKVDVVVTE